MRKLAVLVMIPALMLLAASTASAFLFHHWGGIQGVYAMTATGNCLHTWTGSPPWGGNNAPYAASNMVQGFFQFRSDGTGTAWGENWPITPPTPTTPGPPVAPGDGKFYFEFKYEITHEGAITVWMITESFLGTNNVNGFTFGSNDCADAVKGSCTMSGMVSRDHKTMTLATKAMVPVVTGGVVTGYAPYTQAYTFLTGALAGKTMNATCSTARTLFWVNE
jgi:hypothetical protein